MEKVRIVRKRKKNTLRKSTHRLSSYLCLLLFTRKNKNVKVLSKKKFKKREDGGPGLWAENFSISQLLLL